MWMAQFLADYVSKDSVFIILAILVASKETYSSYVYLSK